MDDARGDRRLLAVDQHDVADAEEPVLVARITDRAFDDIAGTQSVAAYLLLRDEHVFRTGEEVVFRRAEKAVAFADDFQASGRENGAAAGDVGADRRENELVLAVAAELFRIGPRHHALDDLRRRPGLDIGETELGQIGVAVGVRRRLRFAGLRFRRKRRVQERVDRFFAVRAADRGIVGLRLAGVILVMDALGALIDKTDKVRLVAKDTDLTFSIKGIGSKKCSGSHNIPDGEIYTAPVKDSVNGVITYNTPSVENGFKFEIITDNPNELAQELIEKLKRYRKGKRYFRYGRRRKIRWRICARR